MCSIFYIYFLLLVIVKVLPNTGIYFLGLESSRYFQIFHLQWSLLRYYRHSHLILFPYGVEVTKNSLIIQCLTRVRVSVLPMYGHLSPWAAGGSN